MTPESIRRDAATWLLVGFCRHWRLGQVRDALGFEEHREAELNEIAPFMPARRWFYGRPVRAIVSSQWPKLSAFMFEHEKDAQRMAALVPQIERLTFDPSKGVHAHTTAECREVYRARDLMNRAMTGLQAARDQRKSHGRSAWNVCKG